MHPFMPFVKPAFSVAPHRPDLFPEPLVHAPPYKRDLLFVINPRGANGTALQRWKKLLPYLRSRLDKNSKIHESVTSYPDQAIDITRQAIREGIDAVIAVGGDGMLNQVVNGFFWQGEPLYNHNKQTSTALGLIPMGTGSDFARTMGWSNDPFEAADRISRGLSSKVDVGVVTGKDEAHRYFINIADAHLSAKAGFHASRYKHLGALCYVIGSLQAFWGHKNVDVKIKVNGGEWEALPLVTALCVGNAKYFGGGMKIAPNADPSSGDLEVVILQGFAWYDFVLNLHRLYSGTHLSVTNVRARRVQSIEVECVSGDGDIYVQADGEHLGFLPRKFHILPNAVEIIF